MLFLGTSSPFLFFFFFSFSSLSSFSFFILFSDVQRHINLNVSFIIVKLMVCSHSYCIKRILFSTRKRHTGKKKIWQSVITGTKNHDLNFRSKLPSKVNTVVRLKRVGKDMDIPSISLNLSFSLSYELNKVLTLKVTYNYNIRSEQFLLSVRVRSLVLLV